MTDHAELERAVEAAWEDRDAITPADRRRGARGDRVDARGARPRRAAGGRAPAGRQLARQPVGEEGGAARLPAERDGAAGGRAAGRRLVGQGRFEVQGLDRARLAAGRLPRGADRGGAALGLHRAGRGADAVLRQPRGLRRRGHDGRHLGDGRLLRADRAGTCTSRAGSASAGCSSRCRRGRRSSRTAASSARARRWSRAASCARARCSGMGVFIGQSTKIVDRATGEVRYGEVPPYLGGGRRLAARQAAARRQPGAEPLLRGDRQAGRRADALEDRDQRAAARLRSGERRRGP